MQVTELLSQLKYTPTCTQSYFGSGQGVMFNSTKFRDDAVRFGFSIFSLPSNRYTGGDKNAAKKLLEKDIKWGYACISKIPILAVVEMEKDYGTTMVYSSSNSRNFGSDIADVVYNTTVDSVTPYIVLGCDLKKVKLVGPLSKNSSRDTDGDGLSDSQEINWTEYETLKFKNVYDFVANTIQRDSLSHLSSDEQEKLKRYKLYPAYSNPTMADSDGDGFFDGITGKYEPTGYYKVADKWPLTDKPHPAFYQKGGEYYFYSLKHSETPKNIQFPATDVGGRSYDAHELNLSEDEQKYIYKLCSIVNNDDNFSGEISPLIIMAICAHETSCKCMYNRSSNDIMGYMQVDYKYVDAYCKDGQWDDTWLKKLRLEVSSWTNVTQKDFNIFVEKNNKARIDELLKDNPFVNIMFGISFLYQNCINEGDMWNGLDVYCGRGASPYDDTYYTEILAKLIYEEVP